MSFSSVVMRLITLSLLVAAAGIVQAEDERWLPNPFPRENWVGKELHHWHFNDGTQGFSAQHDCILRTKDGVLKINATGNDPYLISEVKTKTDAMVVRLRMRQKTGGRGQLFWTSAKHPNTVEARSVRFKLVHDGQWHEYEVPLQIDGHLTSLRLDPGTAAGDIEVDWIAIYEGGLHPLEITRLRQHGGSIHLKVHNHDDAERPAEVMGTTVTIPAGKSVEVTIPSQDYVKLMPQPIGINSPGLPAIRRKVWVHWPVKLPVERVTAKDVTIEVTKNGSMATIKRHGKPVAVLAPIVHRDFVIPKLKMRKVGDELQLSGEDTEVTLALSAEGDVSIAIKSGRAVEGPVVRAIGAMEQGLLAGVEYLGKGEVSSSKLDIETAGHLRFAPEPRDLTMPLMAYVTDRATVAMTWNDMTLQPTFATPDFVDGTPHHRMSLRGKTIAAVIHIGPGWGEGGRLEAPILWVTNRRGLPELPPRPRSLNAQNKLYRHAYHEGLIHDAENGGWFHAVVPGRRRMPNKGAYGADHVSAIWKLTGQAPATPKLQPGGAHVRNGASFFITGRTQDWLNVMQARSKHMIKRQQPDGSFRYEGKFRRGHFENTASGWCARSAYALLEHAYYTGDEQAKAAGLKTLAYMRRFRTPRGDQVWEIPLHTPDILASAHLVWAYVRGYELTGEKRWLDEAKRWAITGLPFVYQWSDRPIMAYATTPVLGATNWRAPNWIGLPVQWCGTVYAYALLMLAEHDDSFDWRKVAEGITICGERMVYPDGPSVGTLPDVFDLAAQARRPADINPGALISLRLQLDGKLDALSRAENNGRIVVAPYPVTMRKGEAHITATPGAKYQVLIDGKRIVDVTSKGKDLIPLD